MDNIFKISFNDFKINTIIGILPDERKNAQNIILDLDIFYIKNEILDYAKIYNLINTIFSENKFLYLEDAISFIIEKLNSKDIQKIDICITKPNILSNCIVSVSKTFVKF